MDICFVRRIHKAMGLLMFPVTFFFSTLALAQDKEFDPYSFDPGSVPSQAFESSVNASTVTRQKPIVPQASPQSAKPVSVSFDLSALTFLEGDWRGDNDGLVFEESWSNARGEVMTGMARGLRGDRLAVLEYIIVEMTAIGPILRFKHFNADYSNWEGEETPVTLSLVRVREKDVVFFSQEPSAVVQRLRYFINAEGRLQSDITLLRNGQSDMFSLQFDRVSR